MKPGFATIGGWALLAFAATAGADEATPKLSRLQGKASLDRNRDVVGAAVLVRPEDDASRLYLTASDANGGFRIDGLSDGEYQVEVRREGLRSVVKRNVGLRFPFRAVIELVMVPLGASSDATDEVLPPVVDGDVVTVLGKVLDREGQPMSGVGLRLVRDDGGADPRTARSAEDGGWAIDDLPVGKWRIEVGVVGYLAIRTRMDFREDTALTIGMVAQPAGYEPSPLELMPPERPIPPAGLANAQPPGIGLRTAK